MSKSLQACCRKVSEVHTLTALIIRSKRDRSADARNVLKARAPSLVGWCTARVQTRVTITSDGLNSINLCVESDALDLLVIGKHQCAKLASNRHDFISITIWRISQLWVHNNHKQYTKHRLRPPRSCWTNLEAATGSCNTCLGKCFNSRWMTRSLALNTPQRACQGRAVYLGLLDAI